MPTPPKATQKTRVPKKRDVVSGGRVTTSHRTLYTGNGRPAKTDEGSLLRKERKDPTNAFFYSFLLLLPTAILLCPMNFAGQRDDAGKELTDYLGLPSAVKDGLVLHYRVMWGTPTSYPHYAKTVQLTLPGGRDEFRKRFGNHILAQIKLMAQNVVKLPSNI